MKTVTTDLLPNGNLQVSVPICLKQHGNGKRVIVPGADAVDPSRQAFLLAVARGRRWQKLIDEGNVENVKALAAAIGRDISYVARIIRLAMLAPDIIAGAIAGEDFAGLSVNLARRAIPALWSEQKELLTQ
ncbi:MAG: hypothetical protein PHT80_11210 [Lentisphaeria bacterium]|nr:hypothetical protein [Lentisphaeria bacterium]